MKAYVLTNAAGRVVGHVRIEVSQDEKSPTPGQFITSAGHKVHEIEFPDELHGIKDVAKLHQALETHLKQGGSKK